MKNRLKRYFQFNKHHYLSFWEREWVSNVVMIVVRIESGLGNQMLDYAEYLAVKMNFPTEEVYADLTIYDINKYVKLPISMWNGYELKKIFDIDILTLEDLLGKNGYQDLINVLLESKFWENDWIYAPIIVDFLNKKGFALKNNCLLGTNGPSKVPLSKRVLAFLRENNYFLYTVFYKNICRLAAPVLNRENNRLFYPAEKGDFYCGQTLLFMMKGYGIENIQETLKKQFCFPLNRLNEKNKKLIDYIESNNCTSIHARRGDFLTKNAFCYKFGYFKRAVNYIKKKTDCSHFIVFCDTGSVDWVRNHHSEFGFIDKDEVLYVDWNTGEDSFWDIYLMSKCQNNIITQSSFGWWATFFNDNDNKITCSPDVRINTSNWM